MLEIRTTDDFDHWFFKLKDIHGRARIQARIDRLHFGHYGDIAPVGSGVSELRIHSGPGYRVYLTNLGPRLIILLAGGDKDSQSQDIAHAKRLATMLKDDVDGPQDKRMG